MLTMTNTIHSIAGNTNAETKHIATEAKSKTVATTRTGLNIFSSCVLKPLNCQRGFERHELESSHEKTGTEE